MKIHALLTGVGLLVVVTAVDHGAAFSQTRDKIDKSRRETTKMQVKRSAANPCAAHGPGFIRVEGSDTCVKMGGSISVGVGAFR